MFPPDEPPTIPTGGALRMTMGQVREALRSVPADAQVLVRAMLRAMYDEGYMVARVGGSRVCPELDSVLPGPSGTLAPLGRSQRTKGKR